MKIFKKISIFTTISGTALAFLHVCNRLFFHISTLNSCLNEEKGHYYNWRFGNIYYEKHGSGSPILLIHDLDICSSSYEWHKIINELAKTNTVYTLDLLGCGNSEKPNFTYTNYLFVQLVTDFIKNVIKEKTDIIATGESSSIIIMACADHNHMINKIMLINPANMATLSKVPDKNSKTIKLLLSTPFIGTFLYNILLNKKTIRNKFENSYFSDVNKIHERDVFTYLEACHKHNTKGKYLYASLKGLYTNMNILNSLKKINNDIFIIIGNANPENKLSADQYQNQLPAIEIIEIEDTKHLPQLEKPKELIEKINFLFEI